LQVCEYERELADLPQLPEMIFPNNTLTVNWRNNRNKSICFNALDALRLVDAKRAPDVKVINCRNLQTILSNIAYLVAM
jgi:hypothetical protein